MPLERSLQLKVWLRIPFLSQAVCTLAALLVMTIMANVRGDLSLPTPTCPEGINLTLPVSIRQTCFEERVDIYEPAWAVPSFWVFAGGSIVSVIASMSVLLIRRLRGDPYTGSTIVMWQIVVLFITLILVYLFAALSPFFVPDLVPGPTPLRFD